MTNAGRWIWKIALVFIAIVVAVSLYALDLNRRMDARIEAHRADILPLLEDIPFRKSARPALLGPEEPGNGWDLLRPAFDAVGDLYPLVLTVEYTDQQDPDLDYRGVPAETPLLIEQATPALELCRRALRRSVLEWTGPADPYLPAKAGRIGRALCTKAAYAWEAGRDAEAAEWLIVALTVAQDAARLGQRGTWETLRVVERWACQEARLRMGRHDLAARDLEEIGRRLDRLRSVRPSIALPLRILGASHRRELLDGEATLAQADGPDGVQLVPLDQAAGWKDLFSTRVLTVRLLNGLKDGVEEMGKLDWTFPPNLEGRAKTIRSRYRGEYLDTLLPPFYFFLEEEAVLLNLDLFRLAVAFAGEEAKTGRFPQQVLVDGKALDIGRPLVVESGRLHAQAGSLNLELLWLVGRRTKD